MKSKKVILDTNLWISFLISKDFSFLDGVIENGQIQLIFSEEIFAEFLSVIERPKLKKYFSEADTKHLIQIINKHGILQHVSTETRQCRDFKDNFLLSLAIDSNADYLVTRDKDLLVISKIDKTKIVTMSGLKEELRMT